MESVSEITKEEVEEEFTIPTFTETMDSFLLLAEKTFKYDTSGEAVFSSGSKQNSGMKVAFNGYKTIYNKTRSPPTKHIEKMKEVYDKCRAHLLETESVEEFMVWFNEKSSFIITPSATSRNKLYLTSLFRSCSKIAISLADEAKRDPSKADEILSSPAAVYPEQFTLLLLRMFYHCADPSDKETLIVPKIEELQSMLGVEGKEAPSMNDGLGDIMSMAGDIAAGLGLPIPSGALDSKMLKRSMNEWSNNEEMKSTIMNFFSGVDLKNPKDLPNAISKVFSKMQENADAVPEAVQRSLEASAPSE